MTPESRDQPSTTELPTPQIWLVCSDESVKDRLKINIGVNQMYSRYQNKKQPNRRGISW